MTATTRLLVSALPEGWSLLGRARQGSGAPSTVATGCHVLAHHAVGIALLDVVPDATPNAEGRLRRLLDGVDFTARFPGVLPVWQGRIESDRLHTLPGLLDDAFAGLPSLSIPGSVAWVGTAREALASNPAWDAFGAVGSMRPPSTAAPPAFDLDDDEVEAEEAGRGRLGIRTVLAGLGVAAVFVLGVGAGLVLAPEPGPTVTPARQASAPRAPAAMMPPRESTPAATLPASPPLPSPAPPALTVAAAPPDAPATAPREAAPRETGSGPVAASSTAGTTEAAPATTGSAQAMATPVAPPNPVAEPVVEPQEAAPAPQLAARTEEELPSPPAEMPEDDELATGTSLPLPPAAMPTAPPRPVTRATLSYDRRCGEALFRWQQGGSLTAAEMAYVKEGCVSSAAVNGRRRP